MSEHINLFHSFYIIALNSIVRMRHNVLNHSYNKKNNLCGFENFVLQIRQ